VCDDDDDDDDDDEQIQLAADVDLNEIARNVVSKKTFLCVLVV
jgi:hypothetical protein